MIENNDNKEEDVIVISSDEELMNLPWRTDTCNEGESCWCRLIYPEGNVRWGKEDGHEVCIAPYACIGTAQAEHIVEIHNEWLKRKEEE